MPKRRDIRRLAMQVLYQMDLRGQADHEAIRESLTEGPDTAATQDQAFALAQAAWGCHAQADALIGELAPKWPTHRQPPVDRALLRLAYYEMASGYAPPKVAINEAVELAKEFGSEQSPAFINGVLDKIAKHLPPPGSAAPGKEAPTKPASAGDAWLADAMDEPGATQPPLASPDAPPASDLEPE